MERKNLLLAAGHSRAKKLYPAGGNAAWDGELVTIDINPDCGATIVHDCSKRPLPFPDASFDEIHGYDCLEHWGAQGDWRGWFDEMAEYHRLLKPGGYFAAVVPVGADRFADPGHTRFFSLNHFLFLNQSWYDEQRALNTSAADYRWYWKLNFDVLAGEFAYTQTSVLDGATYRKQNQGEPHHLGVLLRKT